MSIYLLTVTVSAKHWQLIFSILNASASVPFCSKVFFSLSSGALISLLYLVKDSVALVFSLFMSRSPSLLGHSHQHLIMLFCIILRKGHRLDPLPTPRYSHLCSLPLSRIIHLRCYSFSNSIYFSVYSSCILASNTTLTALIRVTQLLPVARSTGHSLAPSH